MGSAHRWGGGGDPAQLDHASDQRLGRHHAAPPPDVEVHAGGTSHLDAASAPAVLDASVRCCQSIAGQIRDGLVKDLAADILRLEAAGLNDIADVERTAFEVRARRLAQCTRLLEAVAERIESTAESSPSGGEMLATDAGDQ